MSRSVETIRTVLRTANVLVDIVATLTGLVMLACIVVQIIGRWVENPMPWTEEMTRYAFVWMAYLGVGIGFRKAESARVTMFVRYLPECLRRMVPWIYAAVSAGFFLLILCAGIELVSQQVVMTERCATFDLPTWLVGLSVPVAGLVGIAGVVESMLFHPELVREGQESPQ